MLDGDINEFLDDMYYGDELFFTFQGKTYFLEGLDNEGKLTYYLCIVNPPVNGYILILEGDENNYPLEEFLALKIWDGKTFMEAQEEMQWVDE